MLSTLLHTTVVNISVLLGILIVGRSVVIKDAANVNVVAMCTIGIQEELEDQGRFIDRTPGMVQLFCFCFCRFCCSCRSNQ